MANWKLPSAARVFLKTSEELAEEHRIEWRKRHEESQRRHLEWMASTEGEEYLRLEMEKKRLESEERMKRAAWADRSIKLQNTLPIAGTVIKGDIPIWLNEIDGKPAFQSRLVFKCPPYPEESSWVMNDRRSGMICFLTRAFQETVAVKTSKHDFVIRVKAVRIVGYAASKKAAQIEIVEW